VPFFDYTSKYFYLVSNLYLENKLIDKESILNTFSMEQRLSGKTVLITGASSGIGCSTAFEFARTCPNIRLVLAARRIERLSQICKDIQKEVGPNVQIHIAQLDISKPDEVKNFVQKLPVEFQDIDILVNNAYSCSYYGVDLADANNEMQRTCPGYSTGPRYSSHGHQQYV
jgi:enoyl-[acyl-carrier-protein] reductase (NADH)